MRVKTLLYIVLVLSISIFSPMFIDAKEGYRESDCSLYKERISLSFDIQDLETKVTEGYLQLTSRRPILDQQYSIMINGNEDFVNQASLNGWDGNGSKEDPYIISNYSLVSALGISTIWINNTDLHFVIENNLLEQSSELYEAGIKLQSVHNGEISNNILKNNNYGIYIDNSSNIKVTNNSFTDNARWGISAWYSTNISITHNSFLQNDGAIRISYTTTSNIEKNIATNNTNWGLSIRFSSAINLLNNTIDTTYRGIYIWSSSTTLIMGNNVTNNEIGVGIGSSSRTIVSFNNVTNNVWGGIGIWTGSTRSIVTQNTIKNNEDYGVYIWSVSSNNNTIYLNRFIDNGRASSQGFDYGEANKWHNETLQQGNYWSDWDGKGAYSIDGWTNPEDIYPLAINDQFSPAITNVYFFIVGFSFLLGSTMRLIVKNKQIKK